MGDMPVTAAPLVQRQQHGAISYYSSEHEALPHVVKFSGGRSSAMMTFRLAEAGALRPERGDVVLFANTSAEHPGTYAFARECKERLEREYGLPFLWYEFCTVEDASRGAYMRQPSYRLVCSDPVEANPDGYRSGGEVFEELLSFQGQLPTPHSRSCTAKLKLYPAHALLADWFGSGDGPRHAGHYSPHSFVGPAEAFAQHRRNRGVQDETAYLQRVAYMTQQPDSRPAQRWADFTAAPCHKPAPSLPGPAELWGAEAVRFVTLLGLRGDEGKRIGRIESRSILAENAAGSNCSIRTQPPGERPYFPLAEWGESAASVRAYWSERDFDLRIPDGAGNCTFCFMKGTRDLAALAQRPDPSRVAGAPSDIAWWADIERRYRREAPSRSGEGTSTFGFFGVHGPSFSEVARGETGHRYATGDPACDCTD